MTGGEFDLTDVRSLAARLAAIPKDFHAGIRKPLRTTGQAMLADARANADWSSRIPGSIALRVSLAGRGPGASLRASLKSAPHARVYEGILGPVLRHPLFGDVDHWYPGTARPYLLPAVQENTDRMITEISRLIDDVHRRAGLG